MSRTVSACFCSARATPSLYSSVAILLASLTEQAADFSMASTRVNWNSCHEVYGSGGVDTPDFFITSSSTSRTRALAYCVKRSAAAFVALTLPAANIASSVFSRCACIRIRVSFSTSTCRTSALCSRVRSSFVSRSSVPILSSRDCMCCCLIIARNSAVSVLFSRPLDCLRLVRRFPIACATPVTAAILGRAIGAILDSVVVLEPPPLAWPSAPAARGNTRALPVGGNFGIKVPTGSWSALEVSRINSKQARERR